VLGTQTVPDKNGLVCFEYDGDVRDVLQQHTVEDVFVVVARLPELSLGREGLRELEAMAARAPGIETALGLLRRIDPRRGGRGRLAFRVVARQTGRAAYRRVDAQRAVERALMGRRDHQWRLVEEGGVELWLTLLPREAILALRLSDEQMRHRSYKLEHLPASLRPSAAAALAWLTGPQDDDVFLDPMCGAGTVLIERAQMGRYRQLGGGDVREDALAVARANVGPRYKPIELRLWDARSLPLDAGSVTAAAVNLPWGRQLGSAEDNCSLYPAFLREMARVLRSRARLVALTGDIRGWTAALQRSPHFERRAVYPVRVLGAPASVYVLERRRE
jgi:23S rRNA G2445 N2-methylase RlmL